MVDRTGVRSLRMALAAVLLGQTNGLHAFSGGRTATETGTRISHAAPADPADYWRLSDADRSEAMSIDFGVCVIRNRRLAAEKALALPPMDKDTWRRVGSLATSDCLRDGTMQIPQSVLRGSLFIGLVRADAGKVRQATAEGINFWKDVGGVQDDENLRAYVAVRQFAECVVRADTKNVTNLIIASPGTEQEKASLSALAPKFGPCLVNGSRASFSKVMLVGVLAEVMYRSSMPPVS